MSVLFSRTFLSIVVATVLADESRNDHWLAIRNRLKDTLLRTYELSKIPVHRGHPVNVTLYMWPYDVLYVNEAKSTIKFCGWFDIYWNDHALKWEPKEHANITQIFLQASQIWLPKIDIFYSKEDFKTDYCKECYVKIEHTGLVMRGVYFTYSFPCKINVKYFPFDQQNCETRMSIPYGQRTILNGMMDLYAGNPYGDANIDLSVFLPNEEWDLINITTERKNEFYNYGRFPSLSYHIGLRRKPFYYLCNLITPSVIITVISVVGYHAPSTSAGIHMEKAQMGMTAILSIFILQFGISDKMPRTSDTVPLISIFYCCLVMVLGWGIITTSCIIVLEKKSLLNRPVPRWAKRVMLCRWWRRRRTMHERKAGAVLMTPRIRGSSMSLHHGTDVTVLNASPKFAERMFVAYNSVTTLSWDEWAMKSRESPIVGHPLCTPSRVPCNPIAAGDICVRLYADSHHRLWSEAYTQLLKVKATLADLDHYRRDVRRRNQIRSDWMKLADAVERVSFTAYILAIGFSVLLFAKHEWY